MTVEQAKAFGVFLRHRREALGLNRSQLARLIDTRDSTINRLEAGAISAPRPDKLTRIADYLHLDLADVFAMVGYAVPRQLPACLPYLRAKYPTLPQAAIEEMESDFKEVAARHGVGGAGPGRVSVQPGHPPGPRSSNCRGLVKEGAK